MEEEAEWTPDEDERARVERERVVLALEQARRRCGGGCGARSGRAGHGGGGVRHARGLVAEDVGGEARAERVGDDADFAAALFKVGVAADKEAVDAVGLFLWRTRATGSERVDLDEGRRWQRKGGTHDDRADHALLVRRREVHRHVEDQA